MTNIKVSEKTDINPMGFTYTLTEFHNWVGDVVKIIKKTFEPIGLNNVVFHLEKVRPMEKSFLIYNVI